MHVKENGEVLKCRLPSTLLLATTLTID